MIVFLYFQTMSVSIALYITFAVIIATIIGLAGLLKAIKEIGEFIKPIKQRLDDKLFTPLEVLAVEVTSIKSDVSDIRVTHQKEIKELKEALETQAFKLEFMHFKHRYNLETDSKAYFILDENGRIEFANAEFCNLVGLDGNYIESKYFYELAENVGEKSLVRQLWQEAYTEQAIYSYIHELRASKRIRIEARPFVYNGQVKKYFGFISNIVEYQLREEQ